MQLTRLFQSAGLALTFFTSSLPSNAFAQSTPATSNIHTDIQPFVSFSVGPSGLMSKRFKNGGDHPIVELSVGARKRATEMFGIVISANYGKMLEPILGGEDAVCRIRTDGQPGCYPNSPLSTWAGASAGGEAYLGKTILSLQFGPTAIGVPKYERDLVAGSPSREWGLRSQFEANFPIYRQLGVSLSAVDRYVPSILRDKWHISSFGVGLTLREFHR